MKIIFSETAKNALESQAKYLIEQSGNLETGLNFLDNIESDMKNILTKHPRIGHPIQLFDEEFFKLVLGGYTIIYRIKNDSILIDTIFRENLPKL